jgi:RND family efflux transporter MFP subunit
MMTANFRNQFDLKILLSFLLATAILFLFGSVASAQFEGFTEPYRVVELASDENGIVETVTVREGDHVSAGDVLVILNNDLQRVQMELATHLATSQSGYEASKQAYDKRKQVFEQVAKMRDKGFVNENELLRAEMEMSIAWAKLKTSEDELIARQIEARRAEIQFNSRHVKAPFDGIVSKVHRQKGEYVSPINADILTLIDDSQLYAVFNIPSSQLKDFTVGREVALILEHGGTVTGQVDSIGLLVDSRSGTVEIKVLVNNAGRKFRAGESCTLNI